MESSRKDIKARYGTSKNNLEMTSSKKFIDRTWLVRLMKNTIEAPSRWKIKLSNNINS
jgi:hypothetical protein